MIRYFSKICKIIRFLKVLILHVKFYNNSEVLKITDYINHGRITKWTQHISFLTLAGMERVVEGNHGNDSKGLQEFCVYRIWRNLIKAYIFIFMSESKTNACMCYIVA